MSRINGDIGRVSLATPSRPSRDSLENEAWTQAAAGVQLFQGGGLPSTQHTAEDIDKTIEGFQRTVLRIRDEGMLEG